MRNTNPISMAFNLAGVAAVLVVGVYGIRSFFERTVVPVCTATYPTPTRLSLVGESGDPMTPIELQGHLGGESEWGVLENAEVVREGRKGSEVLKVKLAEGTSSAFQGNRPKGGVGFSWAPSDLQDASAVCLSYRVKLPEDFEFAGAGLLPGIYGGEPLAAGAVEGKKGFATRLGWLKDGGVAMLTLTPAGVSDDRRFDPGTQALARGRWVDVASEIVLNTPGASDGILRLWIDGEIAVDVGNVDWRGDNAMSVTGVAADVSYGNLQHDIAAPKDTGIELSPFHLSWK